MITDGVSSKKFLRTGFHNAKPMEILMANNPKHPRLANTLNAAR
jgi:hypothetical protein